MVVTGSFPSNGGSAMAQAQSGCKTGFKFGCFGCLAVLVLLIVATAIVFGIAWNQVRNEEVERAELTQVLTAPEVPSIDDAPVDAPTEFVIEQPAGRIVLDLRHTKFDIVPAPPGEPLLVEAKFDAHHYSLNDSFDKGSDDDGWTYEVRFRRTSDSYALTALKELLGGTKPRVKVHLPSDLPYELEADFIQGGAEVELGGLWLTNVDIRFLQGGGAVEFSEPLQQPAELMAIQFTQGGGAIMGVGNASPSTLDVAFSMGGGYFDLRGPWQRDAEITINQSMGGVSVQLPRDVVLRGIGRYDTEEPAEAGEDVPVLRFSTSSHLGELEFIE
jgi:hypothetical protein